MAKTRTHWDNLIKNINKYNETAAVIKRHGNEGLNRTFLAEEFNLLFTREKKKFGSREEYINVAISYDKAKELYGEENIKEYMKQRKEFLKYVGAKHISGSMEDVGELASKLINVREKNISNEWKEKDNLENVDYKDTRLWTSEDWNMVDEFKKHLKSSQAVELAYAIKHSKLDIISKYHHTKESTLKHKINKYTEIYASWDEEYDAGDIIW